MLDHLPQTLTDKVPVERREELLKVWNDAYCALRDGGTDPDTAETASYTRAYEWINELPVPESLDKAVGSMQFLKFVQFSKINIPKREVTGVFTDETPDRTNEICDYDSSKPLYQEWSDYFAKNSGGQSLGNVREMHGLSAAGKVTNILFDDGAKRISGTVKVVDDNAWKKVMEHVYNGFSHGGDYVGGFKKEVQDGKDCKRYTAKPAEISLVDSPCNPNATFELVRADGTVELRKFNDQIKAEGDDMNQQETEAVANAAVKNAVSLLLQKGVLKAGAGVLVDDLLSPPQNPASTSPVGTAVDPIAEVENCPDCNNPKEKCSCATKVHGSDSCPKCGLKKEKCNCADKVGKGVGIEYADLGYQADKQMRHPLDSKSRIQRAWASVNLTKTATLYSPENLVVVKAAIVKAWKANIGAKEPVSAEKMAHAVTISLAKVLETSYKLTPAKVEKVFENVMKLSKGGQISPPVAAESASNASEHTQAANFHQGAIDALQTVTAPNTSAVSAHEEARDAHTEAAEAHASAPGHEDNAVLTAYAQRKSRVANSLHPVGGVVKTVTKTDVPDAMKKGMNAISRLAQLVLELAWLKWSVDQEQEAEGDKESTLPASLQEDITNLTQTLVEMGGEETKELVQALADGKVPDEGCAPASVSGMNCAPAPFYCASEPDELKKTDEVLPFFKATDDGSGASLTDDGYNGYEQTQPCPCPCSGCRGGDCSACNNPLCCYVDCDDCPNHKDQGQGFYFSTVDLPTGSLSAE